MSRAGPSDAHPATNCRKLRQKLAAAGVRQAWAGNLDGLFHRDVAGANVRLAEVCREPGDVTLVPFGSINPRLPDWLEDLRRCAEVLQMPGIRLHPNYHGYRIDEPLFAELLDRAVDYRLVVQLVVRMDDVRVQHPLMQVPDTDTKALAGLVKPRPNLRLVLLNGLATVRGSELTELAATRQVWFDIATKEGIGGVAELAEAVSPERVLFGSHLPLFALESALLKMQEAALHATAAAGHRTRQRPGAAMTPHTIRPPRACLVGERD